MRFFKEILSQLEEEDGQESVTGFLYTVLQGKGGYFQNVKTLGSFTPQEITLVLRRGRVKVTGQNLWVAKYCENDLFIKGNILCVAWEGA